MAGTSAYLVIGTTEGIDNGDILSAQTDYYRAGLYLSQIAAEIALPNTRIPSKYGYLSIVRVVVRFYVCVDEIDDEAMAKISKSDSTYLPSIRYGPYDVADQAEMMRMLVDRVVWKGALVVALTDDGASKANRIGEFSNER